MIIDAKKLTFQDRDELARESIAEKVIQLLTADIDISPMVIDGDWGAGKTEFCHKLINKFKSAYENYQLIYIDAFQADHADNPLMTILAAVMSLLPETKAGLLQKALPVMRYGLKTFSKAAVAHILKDNADNIAEGLEQHLQDVADKTIDASVTAILKDHEKAQESLIALRDMLKDITESKPIIIFIDELDRCRPDFSVQILEVIKHTFNVEGVKFVLITNTVQLKAAINHSYGAKVDAQRYLDKFLKFKFSLPNVIQNKRGFREEQLLASFEHFCNLVKNSTALKESGLKNTENSIFTFMERLIKVNQLSLREVETLVRHLEIYQTLTSRLGSSAPYGYQLLRVFGVFVFCFAPEVAKSIQNNKSDAKEVTALFGISSMPDLETSLLAADRLAGLLIQECAINKEMYSIPDAVTNEWAAVKREFQNEWREPREFLPPVKEAISSLQLINPKSH